MRVVVFGANGGVGRRAVSAAAEQGHDVVAAARTAPAGGAGITPVAADVRDEAAVRHALAGGADAILWCVGVTKTSGGDVGRVGLPHVIAAATELGIARVVTVSGAGVTVAGDQKGPGARFISALTKRLAADLVADKEGEHAALAASTLQWTEVRGPRLVEREPTGRWSLTDEAPGLSAKPVPKADVAMAMLSVAGSTEWVRRSPFIVIS